MRVESNNRFFFRSLLFFQLPWLRPTLIEVGKHRFFANSDKIPKTLPYACAFVEPIWSKTADGAFILTIEDETTHSTKSKKLTESILPSPSISEVIHKPVLKEKIPSSSMVERQLPSKVSLLSGIKSSNPFADPFRRKNGAFQVYDENNQQKMSNQRSDESATFGVDVPHSLSNANKEKEMIQGSIVEITTKTSALKISEGYNFGHSGTVSNALSNTEKLQLPPIPSADTLALEMMHTRLSAFLKHAIEVDVVSECEAPISVWVTRYVDYTSKYGLGFCSTIGAQALILMILRRLLLALMAKFFTTLNVAEILLQARRRLLIMKCIPLRRILSL